MFWGLLAAMPAGWKSCDGTLGTPDLRDRFVLGAGIHFGPHNSGGSAVHNHPFTSDGHSHTISAGVDAPDGVNFAAVTNSRAPSGTTDNTTLLPLYIALIFVQKI